jgi:hypothetical protein
LEKYNVSRDAAVLVWFFVADEGLKIIFYGNTR